jgi:hypothetical protein
MPPESWLVVTVASAFALLGVAGSPLAWAALSHRRTRAEQDAARRFRDVEVRLATLQERVERALSSIPAASSENGAPPTALSSGRRRPLPGALAGRTGPAHAPVPSPGTLVQPPLIAVPNLAASTPDRESAHGSLAQKYAAIWSLAENGATPEVIARATGQPIGQIELILGLRRQIDRNRTTIPHAAHD